jgi:hypothetical protein
VGNGKAAVGGVSADGEDPVGVTGTQAGSFDPDLHFLSAFVLCPTAHAAATSRQAAIARVLAAIVCLLIALL